MTLLRSRAILCNLAMICVTAGALQVTSSSVAAATPRETSQQCAIMRTAEEKITAALAPYRDRISIPGWSYDDLGMHYLADEVWYKIRAARSPVAMLPDNNFPQWWTVLAHRFVSRVSAVAETIRTRAMPDLDRDDIFYFLERYDDVATSVRSTCLPQPPAND